MPKRRQHTRRSLPQVVIDSPLIDCRLLNLSTSGLAIETSVGLRLGVPYPFRLRDGKQVLSTEATVRWCRLVRNEVVDGESRPVYRAGAAFVEWLTPAPEPPPSAFEQQIDTTIHRWMEQSRSTAGRRPASERKIVRHAPRLRRSPNPRDG